MIALTGTFHSGNRGDACIQLTAVLELLRRFPSEEIVLFSSSPGDDASVYPGARVVPTQRRKPLRAMGQWTAAAAARLCAPVLHCSEELSLLKTARAVVDLSGDGFTDSFGWKCSASHSVPLLLARTLGVPYYMLGQTIGPLGRGRPYYRWLFSAARAVACRDRQSLDWMRELGVPQERLHLTADVAFLLPPAPADVLANALPWADGFFGDGPVIGVTPSNLFNVARASGPAHPAAALAQLCSRLAEASGARVLIIPTVFGPGVRYDDRASARMVADALRGAACRVLEEPLPPRELKALIGRCQAYVGVRMHGLIAAISQCVPCIGIAYAGKTTSLFARLGLADYVLELGSLETASDLADRFWPERGEIRARIGMALDADIMPAAARNFELLEAELLR